MQPPRTLLAILMACAPLCAQFPLAVPRAQTQVNADIPTVKIWGAAGDTQNMTSPVFSMTAGSNVVTAAPLGSTTNVAAIIGSATAQTVTFSGPPSLDYKGYMVMNNGGPDGEVVHCLVASGNNCEGVFLYNHPPGETQQDVKFMPGDVNKQIRVGGAGGAGNLSHANFEGQSIITSDTMTPVTTVSATGAQYTGGYVAFAMIIDDAIIGAAGSADWGIWGSNNANFSGEVQVYGVGGGPHCASTILTSYGCTVAPIQTNWNSRDVQYIFNPAYAYYRSKAKSTATGVPAFASSYGITKGYIFASTITSYIDPFHVTAALAATHTVSGVLGLWGTADDKAFLNAFASVLAAPVDFGLSAGLEIPAGTYLMTQSIYNGGDQMIRIQGQNANASKILFDPAMTPVTSTNSLPLSYLWMTDGSNGVSFGMMLRDVQIECNDVYAQTCLYQPGIQEDSGLDHVSVTDFNGQYGVYAYLVQNMSYKNVVISGGELPQQMCFLNQTVAASGSLQTVAVNDTTWIGVTGTVVLMDYGWLTSTRERNISTTVVDSTHVSGLFSQAHATNDACHSSNMPVGAELDAYSSFHWDQGTVYPTLEGGMAGGIAVQNTGYAQVDNVHTEAALVGLDAEGGVLSSVGANGNTNVAAAVATYSTGTADVASINNARAWALFYDGVLNQVDQSFFSPHHVTSEGTLHYADRGASIYAYLDFYGTTTVSRGGLFTQQLEIGNYAPTGGNGRMTIGTAANAPSLELRQGCNSEMVTALLGTTTGTPGSIQTGTFPSLCSGAEGTSPALAIVDDNSVFLNRLGFGPRGGGVSGYSFMFNPLVWGNTLCTSGGATGQYCWDWSTGGSGGSDMIFSMSYNGAAYGPMWTVHGALGGQSVFPDLGSSKLTTPGAVLIDTGTGTSQSIQDGTVTQVAAALGIPATGCALSYTTGAFGCGPGGLPTPTTTMEPLEWNTSTSSWNYLSPSAVGGYIAGGSGFSGTITIPKLTTGGSNGSITVVNGSISSVTPAT